MTVSDGHGTRVAVVTGVASGLGGAITRRLAADGFIVASLNITDVSETADARPRQCDVSDPDATRRTVQEVVEAYGRVDGLVNNAGLLSGRASLLEATPGELHRFFDVKTVGPLLMVQACFPWLKESATQGARHQRRLAHLLHGSPGPARLCGQQGRVDRDDPSDGARAG